MYGVFKGDTRAHAKAAWRVQGLWKEGLGFAWPHV